MPKIIEPQSPSDFFGWQVYLCKAIRSAARRERRSDSVPVRDSVYGTSITKAYEYYRKLRNAGLLEELEDFLSPTRGPKVEGAKLVFRLIQEKAPLLPASTRSEMALLIELAHRCDIPPKRVLGFLHELGTYSDQLSWARSMKVPEAAERYR